ncbi:class II glutamine amidotransferase [Oligoflexaceae bacterium]|nr:class II glutamine amidotransferase [Oligoflexaceae bacterium]
MCRLFGFRSAILSHVHTSLLSADNALVEQSRKHPDGWGLAYYVAGAPHIVKSVDSAVEDKLFKRISGVVSSQTVLAHLRNATIGPLNIVNTHPFQFGQWVFAHNGNFSNFSELKPKLLEKIDDEFSRFILGGTDSEVFFYLILSQLGIQKSVTLESCDFQDIVEAVEKTLKIIVSIVGKEHDNSDGPADQNYYTFILTNGSQMIAYNGGKNLHYSTYKAKCDERSTCASYAPFCEAPSANGEVRHLVISSEPLGKPNIWHFLEQGSLIGVDAKMVVFQSKV